MQKTDQHGLMQGDNVLECVSSTNVHCTPDFMVVLSSLTGCPPKLPPPRRGRDYQGGA